MATVNPTPEIPTPASRSGAELLVLLAAMPPEQLESVLANLTASLPAESLLIATPDELPADSYSHLRTVESPVTNDSWTLSAANFTAAYQLAEKNDARAILILGPGAGLLRESALRDLAAPVLSAVADLAIPCYELPPHAGLINSAILYPLTRALFASRVRFPLAIDLGLSLRMAERLAISAQRFTGTNQNDALLWPTNEAAVAGFTIHEMAVGSRALPHPTDPDLNTILPLVTGSLFAEINANAAYWQRPRAVPLARNSFPPSASADGAVEIAPMLDAFKLAYTNLQEVWSLVLPPKSLLGLKRLSITQPAEFRMPDDLWVRIVFDFLVAYRLRSINRGHLLGALIPLYLAWVASHVQITISGTDPERHIEALAAAFEADKPYLVSRWRWPDRFNP